MRSIACCRACSRRLVGDNPSGAAHRPDGQHGPWPGREDENGCTTMTEAARGAQPWLEQQRVVGVRGREADGQRDPVAVDDQMALRARRWVPIIRGDTGLFAGTMAESRLARLRSSWSASTSRSSSLACSRRRMPAACQATRRRQQVTPPPQPSSAGGIVQGMPLRRTKMIPARHARSGTRGRPPLGLGRCRGKSGSAASQSSSETSGLLMPSHLQAPGQPGL
jgi:hypothetical protein